MMKAKGARCRVAMSSSEGGIMEDVITKILHRVDMVESHEGSGSTAERWNNVPHAGQGPLTPAELSELSFLCQSLATLPSNTGAGPMTAATKEQDSVTGFASIESDLLLGLMELLDRHVNMASSIHLVQEAAAVLATFAAPSQAANALEQWLTVGVGKEQISILRSGLEAASIILFIVNAPNMDRRVLSEDAIKGVITLLRLHLSHHLIPALNPSGSILVKSNQADVKGFQSESPSATKRQRLSEPSEAASIDAKDLKRVYKHILATMSLHLLLMDRLESLVRSLPLDDQQVLMLTSGVLPAFEIDCVSSSLFNSKELFQTRRLQMASMGVLTAAFRMYPMHRDIILEDVFPILLNLPTSKRSLRTFPVRYTSSPSSKLDSLIGEQIGPFLSNGSPPHYIQMMTAMILSLVHSCVVRPNWTGEGDSKEEGTTSISAPLQSGLRSCVSVADTFIACLLKRCSKSKGDNAAEYRVVLLNMVEDLLLVLIIPEYPAAELLLSSLQRRLNQDLTLASPVFNSNLNGATQTEATYLNFAFDVLGKICAVQARILATARDKPLRMRTMDVPMSATSEHDVDCHCHSSHTDVLLVQCDHCNALMHGPCVGFPDKESLPEGDWFCDSCVLGQIMRREQELAGESLDEVHAMRYSYQFTLVHQLRKVDESLKDPILFHLSRWIEDTDRKLLGEKDKGSPTRRLVVSRLLEYWDNAVEPKKLTAQLTDDGCVRLILTLLSKTSPLLLSFRKQMEFLLKQMSSENAPLLRKLSLKAIEKCVDGDESLMLLPVIMKAVAKQLSDESISVREAAVALIGNYLSRSPPLAIHNYHEFLVPCLTDPGVSVRKRAIKIFQSILITNPWYRGRTAVFKILLQRSADPKEEDSIRDLIDELLYMLWFRGGSEPVSRPQRSEDEDKVPVASIPGVVTPNSPMASSKRKSVQLRSDIAAEQMMEVVQGEGTGTNLESVLMSLLKDFSGTLANNNSRKQSESRKRREGGENQCSQIVNSLFELLLVLDEQRSIRQHVGCDISATLATIAVFASICPNALLKHFDLILPYLKADNGVSMNDESAIICAVCDILYRLAPVLDPSILPRNSGLAIAKDLTKISYKFGPVALASAIRAFATLANRLDRSVHAIFADKLLDVAKTFYGYALKKNEIDDFASINGNLKSSVHRALTVLGVLCEYRESSVDLSLWKDDMVDEVDAFLVSEGDLTWGNFIMSCYSLFRSYLSKHDVPTKCRAVAALKGIFVSHPHFLLKLDHVGLFDEIMSDSAGELLQLEALECWRNILEAEERRIESGIADSQMNSDENVTLSKRISGDQNGDATLFGGVLTNHSQRLFEMTKDARATIRMSTLRLLGLLLRQGLLNPNEVVPHLFALQGDTENEAIRTAALQLLIVEGDKRPDTLRQRICAGVKEAYNFQRIVYSSKFQVSAVVKGENGYIECIFGSVFEACIVKNRKQRLGLYKSLLGLFEGCDVDGSDDKPIKDLSLLSFAAQILAHLPYNTASDPLFIIHHVTSMSTLKVLYLTDRFGELLRPHGVLPEDELDESSAIKDSFEKAAESKFPSRTQEARPLMSKDFDLKSFKKLVYDATTVTLLLRLKTFLCSTYNLSPTRCLEYEPNAKERLCDKGIPTVKFSEMFDVQVAENKGIVEKDLLLRQYAEFRRLVRVEDTCAFHVHGPSHSLEEEEDLGN